MTTYYDLKIRCPACIAVGKSGGYLSQWYHTDCGGRLQIGDNAYIRCSNCYYQDQIKYWRYACESHETSYRPTNANSFANAIATAAQIANIAGVRWYQKLLDNLDDW